MRRHEPDSQHLHRQLTNHAGHWPALLDPTAHAARDSALDEIVAALTAPDAVSGASPAGGSAGLALLFAQLAVQGHDGAAETAYQHLDAAVATLGSETMHASLLGGFAGVAWVATVLQDMLEGSRDLSLTAELDAALVEHLSTSPWRRDLDLVGGLAGFGVYGLLRHDDDVGRAVIDRVVARLGELAERDGHGCTWFTPVALLPAHQAARFPRGFHNLGLAHGVPGIAGLLAQAAAVGSRDAEAMCTGAVDWLLAQRLPAEAGGGYANTVELGGDDTEQSAARLAWCYGDPGVAAALLVAGSALGRADWVDAAAEVALGAASRPAEFSGVLDAGICHGAAGLALIFHRFHQATGHDAFAAAATSWYRRVLDMRRPGIGAGGYQAWEPDGWKDDPGLLTGSAGVALALLAADGGHAPDWDRILLLSSSVSG